MAEGDWNDEWGATEEWGKGAVANGIWTADVNERGGRRRGGRSSVTRRKNWYDAGIKVTEMYATSSIDVVQVEGIQNVTKTGTCPPMWWNAAVSFL